MSKRRLLLLSGSALIVAVIVFFWLHAKNAPHEAKFDLGKNIVETARATGLPRFDMTNNFGQIEYSVTKPPDNVTFTFARPGLEVSWPAVFDLTLVADHNRTPDDIAQLATLQINSQQLWSHAGAQKFIEDSLAQFAKSQWKRYIPEYCPRVTGRSSLLDESGEIDSIASCPIDPAYRIPQESFADLFERTRRWMWHSGDVYARLTLRYMTIEGKPVYTAFLQFETEDYVKALDAAMEQQNPYPYSPADRIANAKKEQEAIKVMEAAAIKRGDKVLKR